MITFADETVPMLIAFAVMALIYGTFGIVCAVLAPGRGRSPLAWFFIGSVATCVGILLILLLPNLKVEQEKARRREEETRRMREQLKKDRRVADERHDEHRQRIGAHDRALGIDTEPAPAAPALTEGAPPPPAATDAVAAAESSAAETELASWYYAHGGQRHGPVPATVLRSLLAERIVDERTLVWRSGLTDWAPLANVRALLEERTA